MTAEADRLAREAARLLDAGRPAVADLILDVLAGIGLDPVQLAKQRARAALLAGDAGRAVDLLNMAMADVPDPLLLLWRARAYCALGDTRSARRDAKMAAEAMPHDGEAAGLYGVLLIEAGEAPGAVDILEEAIAAGALGPQLHVALMISLAGPGRSIAAVAAGKRARAAYPDDALVRRLSQAVDAECLR